MEPRAHHLLIGLFTLLVTLAAVGFALWLGKSNRTPQSTYLVVFNEPVRGLAQGSTVQYNGIRVGEVVGVSLNPSDPGQVRAKIQIDSSTPVRQNTQAQLTVTGLTGLALISLTGGTQESPALVSKDPDDPPVIKATTSSLNQLFNNGEQLMSSVNSLMQNMQSFLSAENAASFNRTLEHLDKITGALAGSHNNTQRLIDNLTNASEQLGTTLTSINTLANSTNSLLNAQGTSTLRTVQNAMSAIQTTSQQLGHLAGNNTGALAQSLQSLAELGPTLRELRTTLVAVQRIARRLESNPTNFLLGRESIKEYTP